MEREADKIEKLIREKMKKREFDRSEVKGVIAVLDLLRDFKRNTPKSIEGVSEEEINKRIMEMFLPSDRDISYKDKIYRDTKKKGGKY